MKSEKTELVAGVRVLMKRNELRGRSQPCMKGLHHKDGHLAVLVVLLAKFTDWSC